MATFTTLKGKVRAQVCVQGIRESKVFYSKTEAKDWARQREFELAKDGGIAKLTFRELASKWVARYQNRKQIDKEEARLTVLMRSDLGNTLLKDLDAVAVANWRDDRMQTVMPSTVNREWNLLSKVCTDAIAEMGLMTKNPFTSVKRPVDPPPRNRLPTQEEIERLTLMASTRPSGWVVLRMFLFAMQTGMSIGECCELTWSQINNRVATLPAFKTRPVREVPLNKKAMELLGEPAQGKVWDMTPKRADANWRSLCKSAAIEDLHFHDSRHHFATWASKKIDALALAKIMGHRDLKMLLNVYYQANASSLVDKLD